MSNFYPRRLAGWAYWAVAALGLPFTVAAAPPALVAGSHSPLVSVSRYGQAGSPVLTSFSPASGGRGQLVTLTGTDLDGATELLVNGVAAPITANTATSLTFRVPNTAPATGTTTVTTAAGDGTSSAFTVLAAPGNALAFDGLDDYVDLPNTAPVPISNSPYTLEAWIKPAAMGTETIIGWGNFSVDNQVNALRLTPTGITNYWWNNNLTATTGDLTGSWHHVAATFDGTTRILYLDGVELGRDAPTGHAVPNANNLRIGSTNGNEYFNGSIDEVRVWSTARSAASVQADMRTVPTLPQAGLAAYFNFDQGDPSGTNSNLNTVYDLASNTAGTLLNFALSGNTSNWVESYAMVVPTATAATARTATGFVANWTAAAVGTATSYVVEVATDNTFGTLAGGTPKTVAAPALSLAITGLAPSTTYYYRVRANKASVTAQGASSNVSTVATPSNISTLNALVLSAGAIIPTFTPGTTNYTFTLPTGKNYTTVTPTAGEPNETIKVNGVVLASGKPSPTLILNDATNIITVEVTAEDGTTKTPYTVTVTNNCPMRAVAKNISVVLGADGKATIPYQTVNNNSTSACGIATYGIQRVLGAVKNEGDFLSLTAPRGLKFTDVLFASYGTSRYNSSDASFSTTGCQAASSLAIVSDAFLGKESSDLLQANGTIVQANGDTFGDPCPGTSKNLTVQVTYTPELQVVYTCADLGVNRVVLTVIDVNGNKSTDQALVTVSLPPTAATTTWTGNATTDWNDCLNWSFGQVPDAATNVVIPASLTKYPIIGDGTHAVKNLTVDAGATLGQNSNSVLEVNGDWTTNGTATLSGTTTFMGSPATQTVGGSTPTTFGTLLVAKVNGSVQLATDATVNTALTLANGALFTGPYQVTLGPAAIIAETEINYVTGNVGTTRMLAAGTPEAFGALGLTLAPALGSTAPGATTVVRTTGTSLAGVGTSQSIQRYFTITPTTNTGLNVDMVFAYFEHEYTTVPIPEENLMLFKSETGGVRGWMAQLPAPLDVNNNTVSKTGISDFSVWTLGNSATPLPVSLVSFDAAASGATVALTWATASEAGSARFEVERSRDGVAFSRIGSVAAAGTSATSHAYHLTDAALPMGAPTLYYRLRQVDLDGKATYSPVRTVAVAAGALTLFPNPAHASTTLAGATAGAAVRVLDAVGRAVRSATADATGTAQLALDGLPNGVYIVRAGAQAVRLTVE